MHPNLYLINTLFKMINIRVDKVNISKRINSLCDFSKNCSEHLELTGTEQPLRSHTHADKSPKQSTSFPLDGEDIFYG